MRIDRCIQEILACIARHPHASRIGTSAPLLPTLATLIHGFLSELPCAQGRDCFIDVVKVQITANFPLSHPHTPLTSVQMIVEPELRVADFAKAGADIISIHAEQQSTIHLHRTIGQVCKGFSVEQLSICAGEPAARVLWVGLSCIS